MSNNPDLISTAHQLMIPEEGKLFTTFSGLSHLSVQRSADKVQIEIHAAGEVAVVRGNLTVVLSFLARNPDSTMVIKAPTEELLQDVRAQVQTLGLISHS